MRKLIYLLLLAAIILKLSAFIYVNRAYFLRKFDFTYISRLYSQSQYVVGERSVGGIGDDGLYAFAGYYYLFQGGDVTKVNFEHPPLGKYLIGLSIFLFGNENIINIIYFALLLVITYKLGKLILKDNLLSLICTGILSTRPIFLDNLIRSLLDLPFTLFFTAAVYFFLKGLKNPKNLIISLIFWAFAFSTRFFPFFIFIFAYLFLIIFIYERKSARLFLISALSVPAIYLILHLSYFLNHNTIIDFLKHKKWMLAWYSGSTRIPGNIFRNILTGVYVDTAGHLVNNDYWTPLQPILLSLAISRFRPGMLNKKNALLITIYGLLLIYLIYVAVLTDGVQKFILPVYPLFIILGVSHIALLYSIIMRWKQPMLKR